MKQFLYIFTGLPYAGKTTLRRELVKRFQFSIVSIDEIMNEKDMWREGHPVQEDWNVAYTEAYNRLKQFLKTGKSVIFDCGNLPRHERETARQIAQSMDVAYKLIYVNTPIEEIMRRRKRNEETKEREYLDDQMMEHAIAKFYSPTAEEQPIIYNQELYLETWVAQFIQVD